MAGPRRNNLKSQTLGSYAPDRFLITLSTKHRLVDRRSLRRKPFTDQTLAVFFHEYIHYLHNVSTARGFWEYNRMLGLWAFFRRTVGGSRESDGSGALGRQDRGSIAALTAVRLIRE